MKATISLIIKLTVSFMLICAVIAVISVNADHHKKQLEQQYLSDVLQSIDDWYEAFALTEGEHRARKITLFEGLSAYQKELERGSFRSAEIDERLMAVLGYMSDWFYDAYAGMIDDVSAAAGVDSAGRLQYIQSALAEIDDLDDRFDSAETGDNCRADRAALYAELDSMHTVFISDNFISGKIDAARAHIEALENIRAKVETEGVINNRLRLQTLYNSIDALIAVYTDELETGDNDAVLLRFDSALGAKREWFSDHYNGLIDLVSESERDGENDKDTINRQIEALESVRQFIQEDKVADKDASITLSTRIDELLGGYNEELAAIAERERLEAERERLEAERLAREAAEKNRSSQNSNGSRSTSSGGAQNPSGSGSSSGGSQNNSSPGSSSEAKPSGRYPALSVGDRELLARLVRLEGGLESATGKQAIAEVVLNRMISTKWSHVNTVSEVIYDQKWCAQFSVADMIWSEKANPTTSDYTAVDNALKGPSVLSVDYIYFGTSPVTENDVKWIGNHAFSK